MLHICIHRKDGGKFKFLCKLFYELNQYLKTNHTLRISEIWPTNALDELLKKCVLAFEFLLFILT